MRINSANINLKNNYDLELSNKSSKKHTIQYSDGSIKIKDDIKDISLKNLNFSALNNVHINSKSRKICNDEDNLSPKDKITKKIIERLLGNIDSKKKSLEYISIQEEKKDSIKITNSYAEHGAAIPIGYIFEIKEEYYQKQTVDFNATVQIKTPNNSFSLNLNISYNKELYEVYNERLTFGKVNEIDPLVINFSEDINPFENISSLSFEFDLDSNGSTDIIPLLKKGSGFLAYDKNENGTIDDGNELFGTKSGNGFVDLSLYDKDKNNWIDENDSIFNKLKIWQKNENGDNTIVSLLDLNVGAIYLGDVDSGYLYQNSINNTTAKQQSNGIFIKEDGSSIGVISSIDVVT